jgi:hypothetical protein
MGKEIKKRFAIEVGQRLREKMEKGKFYTAQNLYDMLGAPSIYNIELKKQALPRLLLKYNWISHCKIRDVWTADYNTRIKQMPAHLRYDGLDTNIYYRTD